MKDRYIYPAIFSYEGNAINVSFPDLPNCLTFGNSQEEAIFNAKEVLEGYIYFTEEDNEELPKPSQIIDIKVPENSVVVLVDVWMKPVRNSMKNRSIKKTLTIPKWLNDVAEENKVNFSHLLQVSLKEYLGININE